MLELRTGQPPVIADRFEILGTIDDRGHTLQYLAWDRDGDQWATVRILSFKAAKDPLQRSRFEREVRSQRKLEHPNILKVITADSAHPRFPWCATQVAEGGSIQDWMAEHGSLPDYLAIDVMADVCGGLTAAHRARVSHGAIRTQHVLIDRAGTCMVSGLVGGGEDADKQADVKAAGALLFTLLTGRAWDDQRAQSLLGAISPVIGRIIERSRKGRGGYADVAAFSRDLEAAVLSLPMPDGSVPPLAGADAVLPDDPATVLDSTAHYPALEQMALALEDPEYVPKLDDIPRERTDEVPGASTGAAHASMEPQPTSEDTFQAVPYQMSRGTKSGNFNPEAYARGDKPLYEEPAPKDEKQEWTYKPEGDKEEKPAEEAEDKPMVSEATLIKAIVAAALFLVLALVGAVGYGASGVSAARAVSDQAASSLVEHVRGESDLVYQLAREGADRKALEDAYFAFSEAKNEIARAQAAIAFAEMVDQQATSHQLDSVSRGGAVTPLTERIDRLDGAYNDLKSKRGGWEQAAGGFPGILSVWLGIQSAPAY